MRSRAVKVLANVVAISLMAGSFAAAAIRTKSTPMVTSHLVFIDMMIMNTNVS